MARIKIKGRLEPLEISNERAVVLKRNKFGVSGIQDPALPTDMVDLGDWSGEYGRIVEIEMTKEYVQAEDPQTKLAREEQERAEQWRKMSPEEKGRGIGKFKLAYAMRTSKFDEEPPKEICEQVIKIQAAYFKKYPEHPTCPSELYEKLLPPKGVALAEKMAMPVPSENEHPCFCGKQIISLKEKYCSGECMLKHQNGELSTE